jgi:Fe-S cluster biogenesis protein NfuA
MSDEKLFLNSPFSEEHIPVDTRNSVAISKEIVNSSDTTLDEIAEPIAADPDAEKKIIALLDEYIRPAVEGDGGAIDFKSFTNGTVRVVLKGACSGCPSSTVTLKSGIENLLKQMVPGVKEVIAIQD